MIPKCKYFKPYELIDPDILKVLSEDACMRLVGHEVTRFLDKLREDYEGSVRSMGLYQSKYDVIIGINGKYYNQLFRYSGLRSKDCKEGVSSSRHKNGNTFDLKCKHIDVLLFLIEEYHEQYGIYRIESPIVTKPGGWLHIEFDRSQKELIIFNP